MMDFLRPQLGVQFKTNGSVVIVSANKHFPPFSSRVSALCTLPKKAFEHGRISDAKTVAEKLKPQIVQVLTNSLRKPIVRICLPSTAVYVVTLRDFPATDYQRELLDLELQRHIPEPPATLRLSVHPLAKDALAITAVPAEVIASYTKVFEDIGVSIAGFTTPAIALQTAIGKISKSHPDIAYLLLAHKDIQQEHSITVFRNHAACMEYVAPPNEKSSSLYAKVFDLRTDMGIGSDSEPAMYMAVEKSAKKAFHSLSAKDTAIVEQQTHFPLHDLCSAKDVKLLPAMLAASLPQSTLMLK